MSVRTSMSEVITTLRILVDDAVGANAQFTDQQLQDVLDQHAYAAAYEQLDPIYNIAAGGVVEYKKFCSSHEYWEGDTALVDGSYNALTPASSNYSAGIWTFAATQALPVLVYGTWYDVHGAAADVWELKAASYASRFDFAVDGGNYSQSQQYKQALAMAKQYRIKSVKSNGISYLRRSDVIS